MKPQWRQWRGLWPNRLKSVADKQSFYVFSVRNAFPLWTVTARWWLSWKVIKVTFETKFDEATLRSSSKGRGTWWRKPLFVSRQKSPSSSEENEVSATKLTMIHLVNVFYAHAESSRTCQLHNCFKTYSRKMAARIAKLAKSMRTIIKTSKLKYSDAFKVMSVQKIFRKVCCSNGVLEDVTKWSLPFIMAEPPTATVTISPTLWEDVRDKMDGRRGVEEQ